MLRAELRDTAPSIRLDGSFFEYVAVGDRRRRYVRHIPPVWFGRDIFATLRGIGKSGPVYAHPHRESGCGNNGL